MLRANDIIEIAIVSAEGTKSNVENTRNVLTNNANMNTFMVNTDKSKNLTPSETQVEINRLISNGDPKGDGFGYFQEENGSTIENFTSASATPVSIPINGILIVNNQANQGDFTYGQQESNSTSDETILKEGLKSILNKIE